MTKKFFGLALGLLLSAGAFGAFAQDNKPCEKKDCKSTCTQKICSRTCANPDTCICPVQEPMDGPAAAPAAPCCRPTRDGRGPEGGCTESCARPTKDGRGCFLKGIELTVDQKAKIEKLQAKQKEKAEKAREKASKEQKKAREKAAKEQKKSRDDFDKEMKKILTPEQYAQYQANRQAMADDARDARRAVFGEKGKGHKRAEARQRPHEGDRRDGGSREKAPRIQRGPEPTVY